MRGSAGIWWGKVDPPRGAAPLAARPVASMAHHAPDGDSWIREPREVPGPPTRRMLDATPTPSQELAA